MSSDEDDFEVVVGEAGSNDEESDILGQSETDSEDSFGELEDSFETSSIEDLLELENQRSQTESTFIDEDTLKSSLKDLIYLSCVR